VAEPFLGQITQIAFNFVPRGYAWCNGETLETEQNRALYSLINIQFGGNGTSNFKLPDLRGRVPVHPDFDIVQQGQASGEEAVTLDLNTMPAHTHDFMATISEGDGFWPNPPATKILANTSLSSGHGRILKVAWPIYGSPENLLQLNPNTMTSLGGGLPHDNRQPSLAIGFIIALQGAYPTRN
jgi:microcystin-dependent protein